MGVCNEERHYEEYGYTEGCEGCSRLSAGMKPRPHSNACRERMYRQLKGTEEGRQWIEESEASIGDYLESKVRGEHGDREHEIEEKQKESTVTGAADPVSPLANGDLSADVSTNTASTAVGDATRPEKKKDKITGDGDKSHKKANTKQEEAARSQKREITNEQDMDEKTARQQGMTDVSSPGASSPGAPATTSNKIPVGPSAAGKRELDDARGDDEAPERSNIF